MRAPLFLILGLSACAQAMPEAPGAPAPWMDQGAWRLVSPEHDPFDDRPPEVACPPHGWRVEDEDVLEVSTGTCSYFTAAQETGHALEPGDELHMEMWHLTLTAPQPAHGHVAVMLGERVLWEQRIKIPNAGGVYRLTWRADERIPANTRLLLHVHNHGANSWRIGPMEAR